MWITFSRSEEMNFSDLIDEGEMRVTFLKVGLILAVRHLTRLLMLQVKSEGPDSFSFLFIWRKLWDLQHRQGYCVLCFWRDIELCVSGSVCRPRQQYDNKGSMQVKKSTRPSIDP